MALSYGTRKPLDGRKTARALSFRRPYNLKTDPALLQGVCWRGEPLVPSLNVPIPSVYAGTVAYAMCACLLGFRKVPLSPSHSLSLTWNRSRAPNDLPFLGPSRSCEPCVDQVRTIRSLHLSKTGVVWGHRTPPWFARIAS